VTNNAEINEIARMFRDHGQKKKYYHEVIGWNARMDGIQGAVLNVKLKHLDKWNTARRKNAKIYNTLLSDVTNLTVPHEADYAKHIYHVYAIRNKFRDNLIGFLKENDIHCGIHYPVPIHMQKSYSFLGMKCGEHKFSEICADEFISLPMFAELTPGQIEYVADKVKIASSTL
jgi:dTDP-4-amino-4,6-dideoxygalactose transaminase